jgi:DNA sulfur modification protein DndE
MQINIKTSEKNQEIVRKLTTKLPVGTKENVIARIALGYSLQNGRKFANSEFSIYDSKGKEYKEHILFDSKYRDFYVSLICQRYGVYKTNEIIPKYVKLHIDHGLELMDNLFENNNNYTFFDFLIEHLDKGISHLETVSVNLDAVKNNSQNIEKTYFQESINLKVGRNLKTDEEINFGFNNTTLYNNFHIAVAGASGTGKTQFALELLNQITKESNNLVNFIYLDFKGLKDDDLKTFQPFFDKTKATFIDAPNTKFPVNPISFIDSINEKNKQMGIDKFVEIICKYSNLGQNQKRALRDATNEAFTNLKPNEFPSFAQINENLLEIYEKQDTLTAIIEDLSRFDVFETKQKGGSFLNSNIYLSLSGDLSDSVRFTSLFLIINYIYNTFMNMENTPIEHGFAGIRYVMLIDEAHVIFKEKKYQPILDKLLREIRSKGVAIILLSQGIEEYNQPGYDFSSNCERTFLLDIKDKSNLKSINKFLGLTEKEGISTARSLEKIEKGQAVSNMKEFNKGELIKLNQFVKY